MVKRMLFGLLVTLMAILPLLTACPAETTPTPTPTTPPPSSPTPTPQANWWDYLGEPKYGGTITVPVSGLSGVTLDPLSPMGTNIFYHCETMFGYDWTLDPDIWTYTSGWVPPEYYAGTLAESWEQTDPNTITVHLREGVYWHDKEPVNGREFTADDIIYNVDRLLGTGSGFTQPNMFMSPAYSTIERAVAVDKYTVEFRLKKPSFIAVVQVVCNGFGYVAPEVEALAPADGGEGPPEGGPPEGGPPMGGSSPVGDWHNAVGTSPWMLTNFVQGSSVTFDKNPNYWGYDERHPENRLPYADTLTIVAIPETATMVSALRTGRLDAIPTISLPWQQAKGLAESNPEIEQALLLGGGVSLDLRCDQEPFADINVRKALDLAIDRDTIAATHYGGTVSGTPAGIMSSIYEGWVLPYDEWPAELQAEYTYDPDRAREILADAGYPNGFKTSIVASSTYDIDLLQIVKGYFMDIGVDMDIQAMDLVTWMSVAGAGKFEGMAYGSVTGVLQAPQQAMWLRSHTCPFDYTFHTDDVYEELYNNIFDATTEDEAKAALIEAQMRSLSQHWATTVISESAGYYAWNPWFRGYSGQGGPPPPGGAPTQAWLLARAWIDPDFKE